MATKAGEYTISMKDNQGNSVTLECADPDEVIDNLVMAVKLLTGKLFVVTGELVEDDYDDE